MDEELKWGNPKNRILFEAFINSGLICFGAIGVFLGLVLWLSENNIFFSNPFLVAGLIALVMLILVIVEAIRVIDFWKLDSVDDSEYEKKLKNELTLTFILIILLITIPNIFLLSTGVIQAQTFPGPNHFSIGAAKYDSSGVMFFTIENLTDYTLTVDKLTTKSKTIFGSDNIADIVDLWVPENEYSGYTPVNIPPKSRTSFLFDKDVVYCYKPEPDKTICEIGLNYTLNGDKLSQDMNMVVNYTSADII